jgi:ABC-type lipoprotein release transport system permease subunit
MTIARFIRNNLIYYFRKNLLLAAGIAVSGAVLTGALLVGDSVEYSLNRIVELRLGRVTHVIQAGDRYFTSDLAGHMRDQLNVPVSAMLIQEGMAVAEGGNKRVNKVQVTGVDVNFDHMAGMEGYFGSLAGDSIIISVNLANRLNLGRGDEVLLRIEKASLIPLNAPFVSDAGGTVTLRAYIREVAGESQLGNFNLKVSQTAPFNIFMSLSRLEELMEFNNRVNAILVDAGSQVETDQIATSLRSHFTAYDAGLNIQYLEQTGWLEVTSSRVFIDQVLADHLRSAHDNSQGIITYFVNSLSRDTLITPYSFVSTLPAGELRPGEVIINRWLSEDIGAVEGDSIDLSYFVVGPLRELEVQETRLRVKAVVPIEDRFADGGLMPDLPGLSDAGNCRDWDTGVPIELEQIRDKDEDYWDRYAGIPKAFISIDQARGLWTNRFGTFTAIRIPASPSDAPSLESSILEGFDPGNLGFTLQETRSKGYEAAGEGVDFTELFAGLSFFLLVAGILLTVLLFLLNLESRYHQLGTLVVMGIPLKAIRRIILIEGMVVALVGALVGLGLSVVYNRLVFMAMNGVWKDVVRTDMMYMDIRPGTLATGLIITLLISFASIYFPLNRNLKKRFRTYRSEDRSEGIRLLFPIDIPRLRWLILSTLVTGLAALAMIASQLIRTEVVNASVFFGAGGLLLVSSVCFFLWFMARLQHGRERQLSLFILSWKNAIRNRTRSMSILLLFAIGAFLVISTGSNRKDLFRNSEEPTSGTGGFLYYAESTVPVLKKLNDPAVRTEFGLEGNFSFVQFRKASGDDASCLNLNRIVNPQVLGVDPTQLEGRFSFVTRTGYLSENDPWGSLDQELPGGLIPAIADETVIKWGLGLKVGDTLRFTNSNGGSMDLLLIGGLAPSVFQGNVLISDDRFLGEFPQSSGTHVFMVEGAVTDTASIQTELSRAMRDLGWDMEMTATRLARFNSVTNTYLSIFMVMGALGLLVGTFGLAVVLSRSILERKQEIALLKAVGYGRSNIRRMVTREYMLLLMAGIVTGFAAAIVATLPSIISTHTGTSFTSIAIWLGVLIVNGWIWIQVIARSSLKERIIYEALRNE